MSDPVEPPELDSDDGFAQSRRVFVQHLTFLGGGVVLLGCQEEKPKKPPPPPVAPTQEKAQVSDHRTFTNAEWAVMTAAVDRILPKDQDPGALEADVPEYIDRILQSKELRRMKDDFLGGLNALDRRATKRFGKGFAFCEAAQMDELLGEFKDYEGKAGDAKWYEILLVLTMEGFLGDPSYGGNKNRVGWDLVGYDIVGKQAAPPEKGYDGAHNLAEHHCGKKG